MLTDSNMYLRLPEGHNAGAMDVSEVRLINVRALIEKSGGQAQFAEKIGRDASYVSQIAGKNPRKPIGDKIARHIERAFNLQRGWLDSLRDKSTIQQINHVTLEAVIAEIETVIASKNVTLSPDKYAKLVALVYRDALEGKGVDSQRLATIIDLST